MMSLFDLFHVFIKVLYCCFCMSCECLMIKAILGSARLLGTRHYGFCSLDLVDLFFLRVRGETESEGIVVLTTGKVFLPKVSEGSLVFLWQFQGSPPPSVVQRRLVLFSRSTLDK